MIAISQWCPAQLAARAGRRVLLCTCRPGCRSPCAIGGASLSGTPPEAPSSRAAQSKAGGSKIHCADAASRQLLVSLQAGAAWADASSAALTFRILPRSDFAAVSLASRSVSVAPI